MDDEAPVGMKEAGVCAVLAGPCRIPLSANGYAVASPEAIGKPPFKSAVPESPDAATANPVRADV